MSGTNPKPPQFNKSLVTKHSPPKSPVTSPVTIFTPTATQTSQTKQNHSLPLPIIVKLEPSSPTLSRSSTSNQVPQSLDFRPILPSPAQQGNSNTKATNENLPRLSPTAPKMTQNNASRINADIVSLVPEFNGTDSLDLSTDLSRFIKQAQWFRDTQISEQDEPNFNHLIQYRLKADAYKQTVNKDISTFDRLKTVLLELYSTTKSLDAIHQECFTATQKHGETIRAYGQRLLTNLAEYKASFEMKYGQRPNEASNRDLMEQLIKTFRKGILNLQLKKEIALKTADQLSELVTITEKTEKLIEDAEYANQPHIQTSRLDEPLKTH